MKKTALLAVALATCLGYAPAQAAEVVSSNIVGYEKITLTPGLNMIGNQFVAVGTTDFQDINTMFSDQSQVAGGTGTDNSDTIMTWDGKKYADTYYFYYESDGEAEYNNKWYNISDEDNASKDVFDGGQGFWYKHNGTDSIQVTLAGQVPDAESVDVEISSGLNFVANPYPVAIAPNSNCFVVNGIVGGTGTDNADSIMTWDGQKYDNTYYFYYESDGEAEYNNKWYNIADEDNAVSDAIFKPAMGFWYKHVGNGGTITFKKPF